jgi:type IV pilus assembly protein PilN
MIKVNLLKDHTVRKHKSFAKPSVSLMGLVYVAIFLLAAGVMASWTRHVNRQIDDGLIRRADLRKTNDELKRLNVEIAKFAKLRSQLEERTRAIDKLREERSGPVSLLNAVIHSIPSNADLWLTSLTQKAESIKIIGNTSQAEVIPDLMNNLTASGIFTSVDLELIERNNDISKFSLLCTSAKKYQAE